MYLGIDIGGTKTLLAVLDDTATITEQIKFPTPQDYDQFIRDVGEQLAKLNTKTFTAAAAGIPGLLDRTAGTVIALGNLPWRNKPIRDDLAQFLNCPLLIENDVKVAGLAEALLIVQDYRRVVYFTISTGIGAGFITDGKIDLSLRDSEIGQMIFPHEDKLMRWETFASGKAIFEKYGKKASELDDVQAWHEIANNLGLGIVAACAITQVEAIIFGGGVGAHFQKFGAPLQEFLDSNLHPVVRRPKLLPDQHAELSVIYGCYELARQAHGQVTA